MGSGMRIRSAFQSIVLIAAVVGVGTAAATEKELLDVLLENGTITQEQYDKLLNRKEETVRVEAGPSSKKEDSAVAVTLNKRGLRLKSGDGKFTMRIGGRLHAQVTGHEGDLPADVDGTDGTEIRRARIALSGSVYEDWIWNGEVDFADNETAVKDFWVGYRGLPGTGLYVGHQKQPYSLSVEMSTNDIPFIERSIDNDLIIPFIDRAIGLRTDVAGSHWFLATGVYGEAVDSNRDDDEGWGAAGRFVVAPIHNEKHVVHLGIRSAYRQPSNASDSIRVRDETTHMSNLHIVDTGDIADVKGTALVGAEAALAVGPFSVFGEYNEAFIDRRLGGDLDFDSWHVATTWTITGESRAAAYNMSSGEFKRLTPARDFSISEGGLGAWEFAMRLASLDVNDGPVQGGEEKVLTTALNWYVNPIVRFMFEWSRILDTDDATELRNRAEDLNILQFRAQFMF